LGLFEKKKFCVDGQKNIVNTQQDADNKGKYRMFAYNFPQYWNYLLSLFDPLTQHASAADGHLQVFHYAKPATLNLVLYNL
jgi:hypothetical protein